MRIITSLHTKALILFALFFTFNAASQKEANTWYFGDKAGIKFVNGNAVALTNGQTPVFDCTATCHSEGSSCISDSSGNLMFYTNGETVWNKNHLPMPNGTGLMGHGSSTQVLIVPKPGSKRYYYIFTTPAFQYNFTNGFRYSVVDACALNSMGDVLPNEKNIKLLDTIAEKVTAVKHSNGVDYWIIVHKFWSRNFVAFQLTPAGITNTVVTTLGSFHPVGNPPSKVQCIGQMKASPDGQKIAIVAGNSGTNLAEYFSFNDATGVLTNSIDIHTTFVCGYYGVSFSPDNTKLYVSTLSCGTATVQNSIFQYNLLKGGGQKDSVRASKTKVASGFPGYFGLQLATNGKIYAAHSPLPTRTYLGCINQPNSAGLACNYADSAVNLSGRSASYGLPNFIDSFKYLQSGNDACPTPTTDVGIGEYGISELAISPNPFTDEIKIQLQNNNDVFIQILDLSGKMLINVRVKREVETIINTSGLGSGIYICIVRDAGSGAAIGAKKMVRQ